jgi:hypothetical protein
LAVACLLPPARAADKDPADARLSQGLLSSSVWVNLVKKTDPAAGKVEFLSGSGSLIDANRRLVLTNYHVVRDKDEALVLFPIRDGKEVKKDRKFYTNQILRSSIHGKVIARDRTQDLALIELDAVPPGAKALRLAAHGPRPGERIHSLGNPGDSKELWLFRSGEVEKVTHQKVNGKTTDGFETHLDAEIIFTTFPTRPGESGGPLINDRGELTGVVHGHVEEKLGGRETDHGVFIGLDSVKLFLDSRKLLAKSPAPAAPRPVAGEAPVKVQVVANKPPSPPPDDPEETAARRLKQYKELLDLGKVDRAVERFQDLVKEFPKTRAAEEAKQLIEKVSK